MLSYQTSVRQVFRKPLNVLEKYYLSLGTVEEPPFEHYPCHGLQQRILYRLRKKVFKGGLTALEDNWKNEGTRRAKNRRGYTINDGPGNVIRSRVSGSSPLLGSEYTPAISSVKFVSCACISKSPDDWFLKLLLPPELQRVE